MKALDKLIRRWQIRALSRVTQETLIQIGARRLVRQARRAARQVPAYGAILGEHGVGIEQIHTPADVLHHCPILTKESVFGRFRLHELCVDGDLRPLANVLTSSGHGQRFSFGLSTARQGRAATRAIDLGLEHAFQVDSNSTLLINALPMGVRFTTASVTLAETSVREDMALALLSQVAPYHDQSILVTDPLFCKRLIDQAIDQGLDGSLGKVHIVLGEETFGEHFRAYAAKRLGQDPEGWTRGLVVSSMGIGEIGLNLFFETRETVRLRQCAQANPKIMSQVIGAWPGRTPPLLFVYDPRRIFVEIQDPDSQGYGALTLSTLDPSLMLPLLRYRTGDLAKRLDTSAMRQSLGSAQLTGLEPPAALPMIALAGREKDRLPDGRPVLDFKDALYARSVIADQLSGAFRIETSDAGHVIHLQMRQGWRGEPGDLAARIAPELPAPPGAARDDIRLWSHDDFPFGKGLDYERKFTYHQTERAAPPGHAG